MSFVSLHTPGQQVAIFQQTLTTDGYRQDGYAWADSGPFGAPVISRIVFPNLTLATGYPQAMQKMDTGLYYHSFTLPTGTGAIGTYLVDGYWYHPTTLGLQQDFYQVIVTAPYGMYSITPG